MAIFPVNKGLIRLATCDERLQKLAQRVSCKMNIFVVYGFRNEKEQTHAFQTGKSKVPWPRSKHNTWPAKAFDITPFPDGVRIPWEDIKLFCYLGGLVVGIAEENGIKIRWGGDWNRMNDLNNEFKKPFNDYAHFELMEG